MRVTCTEYMYCTCIVHKFDPPQQNISTTTNHLLRSPYYTINRTTTNHTPTTPDDRLEDDSRYSIPASARAKVRGAVQFCNWMGIDCFKEDIFCTFNFDSCEGQRFLSDCNSSCRVQNDPDVEEHQGPQPLISLEKTREMELILETKDIKAHLGTVGI